jgi:hypothetical protein
MAEFPISERLHPPTDFPALPEAKAEMKKLLPDMHRLTCL